MDLTLLIIGIIFFMLSGAYLYSPDIILKINSLAREYLFNDNRIMFHRKKFGLIFFSLSIITLYSFFYIPVDKPILKNNTKNKLYNAYCKYHLGNYAKAEELSNEILQKEPNNINAIKQLCLIYFSKGDYSKAKLFCEKILNNEPGNIKFTRILEKCITK